jgi:hypothetical protein
VRSSSRLLAAGVSCALAATLVSPADAATPRRCASIGGKRLVSSRAVKVIERATESRGTVYTCVPPNGRVRVAGYAYNAVADGESHLSYGYAVKLLAVAGTWVAISYTSTIDFHGSEEVDKTFNAANGRSYRFFETGIPEGQGFEGIGPISGEVEHIQLGRSGQIAFALLEERRTQIIGIEPSGARRVLDSAPGAQISVSSLTLEGHTVRWLDAGEPRSATL